MKLKNRYHCKKIWFYIEESKTEEKQNSEMEKIEILRRQIQTCQERLLQSGAEVKCFRVTEKEELYGMIRSMYLQGEEAEMGILLVTDSMTLVQDALEIDLPILVVLHDMNRNLSYPGVGYFVEGFEETEYSYFDRVYCRCRKLPWTVLETKRLRIREQTVEDVDDLYKIYACPEITKYMEGLFLEVQQEKHYAEDYRKCVYEFFDFGIWILEELATGKVIGRAGIEYKEELGENSAELGFVIAQEKQGMGLAYEACEAIINYAKEELGLSKLFAFSMKENQASIQLLSKLGFRLDEGKLREEESAGQYLQYSYLL